MSIKKCRDCGTELTSESDKTFGTAGRCSKCEEKLQKQFETPTKPTIRPIFIILAALPFLLLIFGGIYSKYTREEKKPEVKMEVKPEVKKVCVTQESYVAALSETDFDEVGKLMSSGDSVAYEKFLKSGKAFPLKAGVEVYVEERKLWGKVCFRKVGDTVKFWTNTEAVKCQ